MITTYKEISNLEWNLSPSKLSILDIPNKNTFLIRDLLSRKLKFSDKGNEIGSANYIPKSNYYFIRTKALQNDYFLPFLNSETAVAIHPQAFKNLDLREGDLIISKDANIGEAIILDKDYSNYTLSGALYRLPITKYKFYLLAFLKHHYFRDQLDLLVPKGSTIRHAKTLFLDCKIPFPNQRNKEEIIKYIETLTQIIVNKEKEIKRKNQLILDLIERELLENQKESKFKYESLKFNELFSSLRIDSGYYSEDYKRKKFLIFNYITGAESIEQRGFKTKRGESLAVHQIRKKVHSNEFKKNFYFLIKATNFSEFGTVEKIEYLGTPKKLSLLKIGDVLVSSTGTVGKSILFDKPKENWIVNYNSMILRKENYSIRESAFISCFFRFLRWWGVLNYVSAGGQGGSLAKKWKVILIPKFPELKQKEISSLYYNPIDYPNNLNLENFLQNDQKWNQQAGILELDKSIKKIKEHLNKVLDKIVSDEKVEINFNF